MISFSSNLTAAVLRPEEMGSLKEEAEEHGISQAKLEELLEAWFHEHFEPPTSFGELLHGVFC